MRWSLMRAQIGIVAIFGFAFIPAEVAGQESGTRVIDGGGGASVVVHPPREAPVEFETTVKLAPARQWTSSDGKSIVGELLSWPLRGQKLSAEQVKKLNLEVVRDRKVRLRTGGKIVVVALSRFSKADQAFVGQMVAYHEKWREKEAVEAGESVGSGAEKP